MDRVAVFVDAGYFFARGSEAKFGRGVPRAELQLRAPETIEALKQFSEQSSGLPLLRIYWYDGARRGQPSTEQAALAIQDNVKLRLGVVGFDGKQKGVDSLVVTDMITLARNGAMTHCVLLSGDEDLRVGVQQAQELGVRVDLLGITDRQTASTAQSDLLRREADSTNEWSDQDIDPLLERLESPTYDWDQDDDALVSVAQRLAQEVPTSEIERVVSQYAESQASGRSGYLDRQWNGELLRRAARALQRALADPEETNRIRAAFVDALRQRHAANTGAGDDTSSVQHSD